MMYVALLRGINVGGKNKVEMPRVKAVFEQLGFQGVQTYINSGNIVFETDGQSSETVGALIEEALEKEFGFYIKTLVRDKKNIDEINQKLPADWVNDQTMKCDVMFLWGDQRETDIMDRLTIKDGIDDVRYVGGTILWRVDRPNLSHSGLRMLVGTELYKNMTIRNCNTLRKLAQLMKA